jgi:antitoxin (DNA-binding transcriptional repressor) of toxin-antitoxin stability system
MTKVADLGDYKYPHIDWRCRKCGEAYRSRGPPSQSRCTNGHSYGWVPDQDARDHYADLLGSLSVGEAVVVCGRGPAPLKGAVIETNKSDRTIELEAIDSPWRIIQWRDRADRKDPFDPQIEWKRADTCLAMWSDVYHVERLDETEAETEKSIKQRIKQRMGL